ncbi:unnamed protein product [Miscanthus lutarioriparius]|uniref:DUF4283 domain-containing protein n=1 Tax=Miscanthus lutarioriparius TaxID=422564 RepID=A0A811REJ3_9POAL|nr:unnamed protein product [Miscanthus lutarioriparius]
MWYPAMPENRPTTGNAVVIQSTTTVDEITRFLTRAVLLVARDRPVHDDIDTGDITRVLAASARVPLHEMRTTRHQPEDFLIIFEHPCQRTRALMTGGIRVKGVSFNIIPWTEHKHGRKVTWWYHVCMAIENLPRDVWNLDVVQSLLGEVCVFDKIDRASFRQHSSEILYCWAWMWYPDLLP